MLELNPKLAFCFIHRKVLYKNEQDKTQKDFIENLLQHMDRDVREMHAIILKSCINLCFAHDNKDILELIMIKVFSLIPDDLSKNWLKIHQVLWLLNEVTRSGRAQLLYMIENKLVSKLIDFFLENDSPLINGVIGRGSKRQVMGSNYANPPFDQLILLISYVVRKQPNISFGDEVSHIRSPQCTIEMEEEPYPVLSKEDIYYLSLKQFFEKLMKSHYEVQEYTRLIAHIAFNNHDVSRTIAKKAIVGLNKASADETYTYITVICGQLVIHDKFNIQRFEWILGVAQIKLDHPYIYAGNQQ
jgi:hypothetical protein